MLSLPGGRSLNSMRPPIVPTFRRGGGVDMPAMAERMRKKGGGDDKILAHIHPYEAMELAQKYGYSGRNPHTGLPQYGKLFGKKGIISQIARVVAPLTNPKQAYKDLRKHAPTIGALIGTAVGGPLGGTIGGGLGGLISSRKSGNGRTRPFSNALRGLGHGAIISGTGHLLGNMFSGAGAMPPGASGPVVPGSTVAPNASPGGGIFSSLGNIFGGFGGNASPQANPQSNMGGGIFSSIGDALGGLSRSVGLSPAQLALAGLTGYGIMKGKTKKPGHRETDQVLPENMRPRPELKRKPVKFARPYYIETPEGYRPDSEGPQHNYIGYEGYEGDEGYNAGGYVHGNNSGQLDDVHRKIPVGSFVIDASTLSDIGDGNSLAGDTTLDYYLHRAASRPQKRSRKYAQGGSGGMINARVSSGEKVIPKEYVDAVGKGNNKKGATKLQAMVNKVRKMKRGSERLPRRMSPKLLSGLMGR